MPNESHLHADQPAETHPTPEEIGRGYEVRDTNVRAVVTFAAGLVVLLAMTQVGLWWLMKGIAGGKPEAAAPSLTPQDIAEQRRALNAEEDAILNGRGTPGHPASGVSIAEAIDRVAERGLPRTPDRPRTEVQVNSHSGTPAPAEGGDRGGPETGSSK